MPSVIEHVIPKMTVCLGKLAREQVTFYLLIQIQPLSGETEGSYCHRASSWSQPVPSGQVPMSLTHRAWLARWGFGMHMTREV